MEFVALFSLSRYRWRCSGGKWGSSGGKQETATPGRGPEGRSLGQS